ncbi:MAG: glycoside hydrolase family 3 protein [Clostridia bacterium]|nr:glycoside hydrolase family 3 protein [Clostridia bacterium]
MIDISTLSIDEKLKLLSGMDMWHTCDLDGKLYKVTMADGPMGVIYRFTDKDGKHTTTPSTAFPSSMVLSQTWNESLAYRMGGMVADECIEREVDVILAPGVNIKRDVLCGRNFEYFSEDPLIAGEFGKQYIAGVQDGKVATSLKHYCANNQETNRHYYNSEIDERTLREVYLKPFEIACESKPMTVMCAYNLVNGVRMSENKKLYDILREEFGFDGVIVSDWYAVKDHTLSVKAGLDIEMPYTEQGYQNLVDAYAKGEISIEDIDLCVQRVLDFISKCEQNKTESTVNSSIEERRDLAMQIASEGIVLLKNNGVLPVSKDKSVSLTTHIQEPYVRGHGSSDVHPEITPTTIQDALLSIYGENLIYNQAYSYWNSLDLVKCVRDARDVDVAIVCVDQIDREGADRETMRLSREQESLIIDTARANPNTVVILYTGSAIDMNAWIDKVAGVIVAGYPGEMGNDALGKIIVGDTNPSGKLTETYPISYDCTPVATAYSDLTKTVYEEGIKVGYKYYDEYLSKGVDCVRYPFGHGLSYSNFEYKNISVDTLDGKVKVSWDISNTSHVDGMEVAQVYLSSLDSQVDMPIKSLQGWVKVKIDSHDSKRVEVVLDSSAFEYYDVHSGSWQKIGSTYQILVGASATDIRLETNIVV